MSNIFTTTIRFNLDRAEDRDALAWLQGMDKFSYRSYSRAVIAAVNDHFSRRARLDADPYLETREKEDAFLQKVLETVERGMRNSAVNSLGGLVAMMQGIRPVAPQPVPAADAGAGETEDDLNTALDFIDGL